MLGKDAKVFQDQTCITATREDRIDATKNLGCEDSFDGYQSENEQENLDLNFPRYRRKILLGKPCGRTYSSRDDESDQIVFLENRSFRGSNSEKDDIILKRAPDFQHLRPPDFDDLTISTNEDLSLIYEDIQCDDDSDIEWSELSTSPSFEAYARKLCTTKNDDDRKMKSLIVDDYSVPDDKIIFWIGRNIVHAQ